MPKILNFIDIQKHRIRIIELCVTKRCTQFQANIFIFCCALAQKPIDSNDVIFETGFLEFLKVVRQNKCHFRNPETKLNKIGMFLKENFDFQNLTFLI